MKGIVFTEFLDMVEATFGYEMVDHIIEQSDLPSNGIYTAVGTYDQSEIVALLTNLAMKTKMDPQVLLKSFGSHLFGAFLASYPHFFASSDNVFDFLESIDTYIHVEVQKLYADATLPSFSTKRLNDDTLRMIYKSERRMSSLAEGLIIESIAYYKEPFELAKNILDDTGEHVEFIISRAKNG